MSEVWELLRSRIQAVTNNESILEYLRRTSYLWRCSFIGNRYSKLMKGIVLDAGCSVGLMRFFIPCKVYIGIDPSRHVIKQASSVDKDAHYIVGSAETLPIKDCTLDTVFASKLVVYLNEPESFLAEARRILRKEGHLILIDHNAFSLFPLIAKVRKYAVKHIFVPPEVFVVLRKHGFKLEEYFGFQFLDFALNFLKSVFTKSLKEVFKFERRFFSVRLVDFKVAHIIGVFASKHVYIARKADVVVC